MESHFHNLDEYIDVLNRYHLVDSLDIDRGEVNRKINYISFDSNDIKEETMFICKGAHFRSEYLSTAIEKGAFVYVSEKSYSAEGISAPNIVVNDIRRAMAVIADYYYNQVWKKINMVGITGTKGKSSTAYYMKSIIDDYLSENDKPECAIISGIDNYDGVIKEESHLTTPESMMLHSHINNAVNSDIEYLVMEVSSQALKYDRTFGIVFDVASFLNIGQDHISPIEHPSIEDYVQSKMILMQQCKVACVNLDCDYADDAIRSAQNSKYIERIITFSRKHNDADIFGYCVEYTRDGISFKVKTKDFDEVFAIGMKGLFNVENALSAIAMSYAFNIPVENIKEGLKKARVSGRMEVFKCEKDNLTVVVDYAHNKMSFEALLASTKKEYPGNKIYMVFGCPGKKALGRRKELGEIAGRESDFVIITEEDAGEEAVKDISLEIAGHVANQNGKYEIIDDRGEAIRKAIMEAPDNTVVLLTGKGRETRQKRGIKYVDTLSDVEYTEKYLAERAKRK